MFKKRTIKRLKNMMVDSAKNHPNELVECRGYMIVHLKTQDRTIFLPVNYAGLSDCEIDAALWRAHTSAA